MLIFPNKYYIHVYLQVNYVVTVIILLYYANYLIFIETHICMKFSNINDTYYSIIVANIYKMSFNIEYYKPDLAIFEAV